MIAIFDIGKTNKKLFLLDEQYRIVWETARQMEEITDEDGDACEDIDALRNWVLDSFKEVQALPGYSIKAVHCCTYGASFVHIDEQGKPVAPLYNYLKPYPARLEQQFCQAYGDTALIAQQTASPVLGSLNAGMQLYRLKQEQPALFDRIRYSLHLPQYISYLFTQQAGSDITSIGCHTRLWDFEKGDYHQWVYEEGIDQKLAPIVPSDGVLGQQGTIIAGPGLHDSSAALIPYMASFKDPFVLISTGTWCISLNPFNHQPLTTQELEQDCLCFMGYHGEPVKAARLFAGYEHEQQCKRLAAHFNKAVNYYKIVEYDPELADQLEKRLPVLGTANAMMTQSVFGQRALDSFSSYEEAYHALIADLVQQQQYSTSLVIQDTGVKRIFVDGGFGTNPVFMNLLAAAFPQLEIYAASVAQASSVGAAIALHRHWNPHPLPGSLVALKKYSTVNVY